MMQAKGLIYTIVSDTENELNMAQDFIMDHGRFCISRQ